MAEYTRFAGRCSLEAGHLRRLLKLLASAKVDLQIVNGRRALGVKSCGCMWLRRTLRQISASLSQRFWSVQDERRGTQFTSSKPVWQQAKTRTETPQEVDASAGAHGLPLELPHGGWSNLLRAHETAHGDGDSTPAAELPAQFKLNTSRKCFKMVSCAPSVVHRLSRWKPRNYTRGHSARFFDAST